MVLFNDTEPKGKPSIFGTIVKWLFRIALIIVCFLIFFVGVLNLLHGKGEAQRRGLEGAFGDVTGLETRIGTLNDFKLFPRLIIDIDDVTLRNVSENRLVAHIDHFRFVAPGVVVLTRSNRFHNLDFKNLTFYENGLPALEVAHAGLQKEDESGKSAFVMDGEVKKSEPFHMGVQLETLVKGDKEQALYAPLPNLPFTLDQGNDHFTGRFYAGEKGIVMSGSGTFMSDGSGKGAMEAGEVNVSCLMGDIHKSGLKAKLENIIMVDDQDQLARGEGEYSPATGWMFMLDPEPEIKAAPLDADQLAEDDPCRKALTK